MLKKKTGNKSTFIFTLYIWVISMALILHVFNAFEIGPFKVFQLFAAAGFLISLFYINSTGDIQKLSYFFIFFTILSSLLSPYPDSLSKAIVFSIVLGSCQMLAVVSNSKVLKIANLLIPIPLIFLLFILSINKSYRFVGFYNDPNYLCTTLVVFLSLILLYYVNCKSTITKFLLIGEIIIIAYITVATLSRTGLACIGFIIVVGLWEYIKKHKYVALLGIIAVSVYFSINTPPLINDTISKIESRSENNHDNFTSATNLRLRISMKGVNYVFSHPQFMFFGLGSGSIGHWEYFEDASNDRYIDHNTLTSTFSEQGLIGFCLLIAILYQTFKINWNLRENSQCKSIRLSVFLALLIFSLSINQNTYLPFWWMIIFLNNKNLDYENHSYSRLR